MPARSLLIALLLLTVSPQAQPRFPIHVESLTYPPLAHQARIVGDVILSAEVDSHGHVNGWPWVLSGSQQLTQAAIENLRAWRFQPGPKSVVTITYHFRVDGEPVEATLPTKCEFDLPDSVKIMTPPLKPIINFSPMGKPKNK
jgi:TonB family protein